MKHELTEGGVISLTADKITSGKLDNPEQFFMTRYSVRDFKSDPVPKEIINRVLELSMKTVQFILLVTKPLTLVDYLVIYMKPSLNLRLLALI